MEPSQLVAIAKRWWLLLVVAAIAGGFLAHRMASNSDARYEATAQLLVGPINAPSDVLGAAGQLARTYAELAQSDGVYAAAIDGLTVPRPTAATVTASGSEVTRLLSITVSHPDRDTSAELANAVADELANLADRSDTGVVAGAEGRLVIIEPAEPPADPVAPEVEAITVLGVIAGLVGGAALALLVVQLRRRIHGATDLSDAGGLRVLATLGPKRPRGRADDLASRLVVSGIADSPTARSFRMAAAGLHPLAHHGSPVRTIVVAGTDSARGSGDVAANLAAGLAELVDRVVLVEADPSRREIATLFGLPTALTAGGEPTFTAISLPYGRELLVADQLASLGHRKIDAAAAARLVETLLGRAEIVVIHAGQAPTSLSTPVWAGIADATVVVARRGRSRWGDVEESVGTIRRAQGNLVGALLDTRPRERRLGRSRPRPAAPAPSTRASADGALRPDGSTFPAAVSAPVTAGAAQGSPLGPTHVAKGQGRSKTARE